MDAGRGLWQRLSVPRTPPLLSVPVHAALAASALLLLCLLAVPVVSTADGGTLAAVAVAAAGAAALAALTVAARDRIRPAALGLAWALMLLWPLAGRPLPAAGIAVIAAALVIRLGATGPAARGLTAPAAVLAAGGVAVLAVAWLGTSGDPGVLPVRPAADRPPPAAADPEPPAATHSAPAGPAETVRAYYRALDRRAFGAAWRTLDPAVRADFGGRAAWERGFAATLASRPAALTVDQGDGTATVRHSLLATDSTPCGRVTRRFALAWRLRWTGSRWRAADVRGALRSPVSPCG